MKRSILPSQVRKRPAYTIKCSLCGAIIEGHSADSVAMEANVAGWKYLYEEDTILCKECNDRDNEIIKNLSKENLQWL